MNRKFRELYFCYCGQEQCSPSYSFGPAVRPNYLIHIVLKGKGKFHVGDQIYELVAGQGFLIEPHVQTFYQADREDPWAYCWVGFGGFSAGEYLKDAGLDREHPVFRCRDKEAFRNVIGLMLDNRICSASTEYQMQSYLYNFFTILLRETEVAFQAEYGKENFYVRKAVEFVQNNFHRPIRVTDMADYVGLNRSYLYTLFQKALGQSPQEYLKNFRLSYAAELLQEKELSVESIAYSSGYRDPLVFSKAFRQKYNLSPAAYRKQI